VTYVDKKGDRQTMPLNLALESNNAEMTKRLKYTKDILTHMLGNNKAGPATAPTVREGPPGTASANRITGGITTAGSSKRSGMTGMSDVGSTIQRTGTQGSTDRRPLNVINQLA